MYHSLYRPIMRLTVIIFAASLPFTSLHAAPEANLWSYWSKHNENNTKAISHQLWQKFLSRYVISSPDGTNRVRYQKVTTSDRELLSRYLQFLSQQEITNYPRLQQKAYWINLYNALTVDVILDHYPVSSIKDIRYGSALKFWQVGPWDEPLIQIEKKELSLNDIEHRILRPIFKDSRVHYAVNCASIGCPNLAKRVYTAKRLDKQLQGAAISFVNQDKGVSFKNKKLVISKIYQWFREDFANNDQQLLDHLANFAKPPLVKLLQDYDGQISYQYDWALNAAK